MREDTNSNDLQEIITQAIEEIKNEQGDGYSGKTAQPSRRDGMLFRFKRHAAV